ncbi:MAG: 3-oxoacyl-ACP synthase [bacterium]|nr:3-oxoacyl-ACP synthase [bacterium]
MNSSGAPLSPDLPSAGMLSLAISVPDRILTNDHWRENHPEIVAQAEERIWMWKKPKDWDEGSQAFNIEMAPYVRDPFRGARQRRWIQPDGCALELEADAARQALDGAGLGPDDVDLLICTSFVPDVEIYGSSIGGATPLARELGLRGAAWNIETACSSMLLAFQTACALVRAGQYRRILVVVSTVYSRLTIEPDPISWGVGDAAVAMVVAPVPEGVGHLGSHSVNSSATYGAVVTDVEVDEQMKPRFRLRAGKSAARLLRETSEGYLKECTGEAMRQAGVELSDIKFCVFNTPLAWYARFCARALGVDASRTISVYPFYANVGPVLPGLNLLHAARWGRFREGDLVLLYSVGSISSCCAVVVRWGKVALGALPEGATLGLLENLEADARQAEEEAA